MILATSLNSSIEMEHLSEYKPLYSTFSDQKSFKLKIKFGNSDVNETKSDNSTKMFFLIFFFIILICF